MVKIFTIGIKSRGIVTNGDDYVATASNFSSLTMDR